MLSQRFECRTFLRNACASFPLRSGSTGKKTEQRHHCASVLPPPEPYKGLFLQTHRDYKYPCIGGLETPPCWPNTSSIIAFSLISVGKAGFDLPNCQPVVGDFGSGGRRQTGHNFPFFRLAHPVSSFSVPPLSLEFLLRHQRVANISISVSPSIVPILSSSIRDEPKRHLVVLKNSRNREKHIYTLGLALDIT